ncbi:hypothetical protein BGX34_004919 [Mortierella sp. NVP85]|nr:hypothetical protein BGX34_004919 [Mortierella sp. NVP85]
MATPALFLNALTIVLGSFQYGYHIGELNSPQHVITTCPDSPDPSTSGDDIPTCIPMSNSEWSVLVATLTLGGLIGALFLGSGLANHLGRRRASMLNSFSLLFGSLVMGTASTYQAMLVGRFLIGIGCGVVTVIVPMYLAEVSPPEHRGSLGWRTILLTGAALSALQMFLLPFCVESPRFLALQPGGAVKAKRALQILRGRQDVGKEIRDWTRQDDRAVAAEEEGLSGSSPLLHDPSDSARGEEQPLQHRTFDAHGSGNISVVEFVLLPQYRRQAIILLVVQLTQQLSGINGVIFYSTAIMSQVLPSSGAMITVYISIVNTIMTLISAYLMDKAPRRTLLLTSSVSMGACSFVLAFSLGYEIPVLSAISIIAFVASFAIGLGPIPFLIIPEVVDTVGVASASAFALSINFIANFTVAALFLKLQEWWGGNVFYLFCMILAGLSVAMHRIVPETKGKTPEEVARSWQPSHAH